MKATIVLAVLLAGASSAADEPPPLPDLLAAVGRYVRGFERDFATVISDETYEQRDYLTQRVGTRTRTSTSTRTIRSETLFLWLPVGHEWLTVRIVRRVDRQAVPLTARRGSSVCWPSKGQTPSAVSVASVMKARGSIWAASAAT
jgi:hypothetical protein